MINNREQMQMADRVTKSNQFIIFDRIFWVIWLVFPVTIWLTYASFTTDSPLLEGIPESCRAVIPIVSNLSSLGKAAFSALFLWQFALYAFVFFLAHRSIRQCMNGSVLVNQILRTLGIIGAIVTAWAFIQFLLNNAFLYVLKLTGDVKVFAPEYAFDVGLPALGILILAMRAVIAYAIEVKRDQDLTI
jgi:hypothetical protein